MLRTTRLAPGLPEVCRLGLATRGTSRLRPEDVEYALSRGVNYLNWCGKPDGLSEAVSRLGKDRRNAVVAVQFQSRTREQARREFASILERLRTDYLDVATLYYVESEDEWRELIAPRGAWEELRRQKEAGALRMIGLTSHQRKLAARWAASRTSTGGGGKDDGYHLDLLMVRYNAAHRGAEEDVFPAARARSLPVVTFTGLRWGKLPAPTPSDPAEFDPPPPPEWYRFCLAHEDVSVALTAPCERAELEENLTLLDDWRPPSGPERETLRAHGDRVKKHAGRFW